MLADHLIAIHHQFMATLTELTRVVSDSARPVSSTSPAFKAHSVLQANAGHGMSGMTCLALLYGALPRVLLVHALKYLGFNVKLEYLAPGGKVALNCIVSAWLIRVSTGYPTLLLDAPTRTRTHELTLRRGQFSLANAEATRKILKKHTKRTALPAIDAHSSDPLTSLWPTSNPSLSRILVQELGTTLLPIPIRLSCGHLFCVRCLVKMQKRGNGSCPMCRTPCVLQADRSNVDWALLNFMRDWFPEEASLKLRQNEREAAEEELLEMGLNPNERCVVT
ncbi:hypothetical protein C8R44DRAFT_876601 [Mycena epipterygia]|nr:hypothetical protein C8R44DRAFT_876601 [Mycena epipterygia]